MYEIEKIRNWNEQNCFLVSLFNRFLASNATPEELVKTLVINHKRSKREALLLSQIYNRTNALGAQDKVKYINKLVTANISSQVKNKYNDLDDSHFAIHILPSDTMDSFLISNDWRVTVEQSDIIASFKLHINLPNMVRNVQARYQIFNHAEVGVIVPICWTRDFYKMSSNHSSVSATLLTAYDSHVQYVNHKGTAVRAREYYLTLLQKNSSLPWYKRLIGNHKLLKYNQWIEQQNTNIQFINDAQVYELISKNIGLQAEFLKCLTPYINSVETQFNYVWHDLLNYDALVFGNPNIICSRKG